MKQNLLTVLGCFLCNAANALDFEVNGIDEQQATHNI